MPRPKRYGSEAEKQAAYRLRKKEAKVESKSREKDGGIVEVTELHKIATWDGEKYVSPKNLSGAGAEPDGASAGHAIPEGRTAGSNPATGVSPDNLEADSREGEALKPEDNRSVTRACSPPDNLPVLVLADQTEKRGEQTCRGEARDSTQSSCSVYTEGDSRGGQNLSKTDQKFDVDRPGWYIFGSTVKERTCWKCGKKFSTRLEMNKFCSPACKNEYLDTAFTKLRE